ncbi:hypothetical protein DKX38_024358 [Salix brachista]|uniref:Pentacotripeptide-repeat region of PRORP domain-containing protein n=1 Tax=Salix brachista TaxID=2182728 RepID=A0A5N5JL49_9ROSI|nr:hypothetical protein DKX38_024358 [Salix brachista]
MKRRFFKFSDAELFCLQRPSASPTPRTLTISPSILLLTKPPFYRFFQSSPPTASANRLISTLVGLFVQKLTINNNRGSSNNNNSDIKTEEREDLINKISSLRDELLQNVDMIFQILEETKKKDPSMLTSSSAFLELLKLLLLSSPKVALKVFNWKRTRAENDTRMTAAEYAKGIMIAGRNKNVDLAVELFDEATKKCTKTTSMYNALMSTYSCNGLAGKCESLFLEMKRSVNCRPSVVTYNILVSVSGRLMLVDNMEAIIKEMEDSCFSPNLTTYNNLISGYVTAWMWDSMEKTFQMMNAGPVKPDLNTYLLMLRGYAHSGNLEQMELVYELIKEHVNARRLTLITAMICAYCKSSVPERVQKIEALMRLIPEMEYRPWLNVLLIKLYAEEGRLEEMENSINEAFEHKTIVSTISVMQAIVKSYYRCNAVDRLTDFIKRATYAHWRIIRPLYHCKMVMYGTQKRLDEMESVLIEMENCNLPRTKKTFWILYKAYLNCGQWHKVEQLAGLMCKHGYGNPFDSSPL